ncbi:MAG TPA: hypothetical protein VGD74_07305, partial [Vulgatibacter sp.]
MERIATSVSQLMGIRQGEGERTALAAAYHLAFVAAVVLVKSASNALVVSRFKAEALPLLYVASAIATGLAAWSVATVGRHRSLGFPRQGLILGAASLGGLALALHAGWRAPVIVLYLFGEAIATLVSIRFWGAASEIFDPRAGRRIFGILGAAGMVGAILAGLAAQLLGPVIGAVGLLPLGAGCLLAGVLAAQRLRKMQGGKPAPSARSNRAAPAGGNREARAYLLKNRYPRALATLMLLLAALTALADYVFRHQAGERYTEAELAALFGA